MLFLINEQKKKTTRGGKWLCRVFLIQTVWQLRCLDITERMSEITKREKQFDWVNLTIHYGSWTGSIVLTEAIRVHRGNDVEVQDISIF